MLRISVFSSASGTTLKLTGALCDSSADQLESCWQTLKATAGGRPICVNLNDVLQVGGAAEELLDRMRKDGVIVVDTGHPVRRPHAPGDDRRADG
ncbi:MAG TPA: hypothetical protein VG826_26175 [Pirellulales bacterium]|nr:hypothetical protein [Pirellulales bacterium]